MAVLHEILTHVNIYIYKLGSPVATGGLAPSNNAPNLQIETL